LPSTVGVGDPDCPAASDGDAAGDGPGDDVDGEGDAAGDAGTLADTLGDAVSDTAGDAGGGAVGDAVTKIEGEVRPTWPSVGSTATGRVPAAAKTAAPNATRPAMTTIGTIATRLPKGKSSRQFGQKPETGIVV
jgi:hypothetical protein